MTLSFYHYGYIHGRDNEKNPGQFILKKNKTCNRVRDGILSRYSCQTVLFILTFLYGLMGRI